MTPFVADPDFTLYLGDVREVLAGLPGESVDCAMTSPPFYALRDYGMDGPIGLEETPEEWADELVGVFREVRRVLKSDGTLWVECGDSYSANAGNGSPSSPRPKYESLEYVRRGHVPGIKPKDLVGGPWLLAFALRADGWYLRQSIIWAKPNAMPESATDRCTTAHSYVFLLSKSARYHFDADAIAEPAEWARWGDQTVPKYEGTDTASGWMQPKTKAELQGNRNGFRGEHDGPSAYIGQQGPQDNSRTSPTWAERKAAGATRGNLADDGNIGAGTQRGVHGAGLSHDLGDNSKATKNPRSVWTIPTQGYSEAHFATWPEALCERIIKAGCPEGGVVLDPFMGSGTTALVARRLGRRSIGIELSPEYAALAAKRLSQLSLLAEGAA